MSKHNNGNGNVTDEKSMMKGDTDMNDQTKQALQNVDGNDDGKKSLVEIGKEKVHKGVTWVKANGKVIVGTVLVTLSAVGVGLVALSKGRNSGDDDDYYEDTSDDDVVDTEEYYEEEAVPVEE